jgi:hypothetical protein
MNRLFSITTAFAILLAPALAVAKENYFLQLPVAVDPATPIPEAVKNECAVEMLIGNYALSEIGKRAGTVQSVAEPGPVGDGKTVQITILAVRGWGGGAWTGPKSMTIRVDLKNGEALAGTTVLRRNSSGGMFGGFSGTCTILDRVAGALGKDVAVWLARGAQTAPASQTAAEPSEPTEEAAADGKK